LRVAVIVVSLMVVTTPSEASKSCMTKTEARQHFGSVHIYWHGQDHCWDAIPTRRHHQGDATPTRRHHQIIHNVQQKIDEPKWHQAMSEMLPNDELMQTPWVNRWVDIEPPPIVSRWVDIVQLAPPLIVRKPEPMVTPRGVVIVIVVITLTLAIVMFFERPTSKRNTLS
jgi:hypothetical protein